MDQWLLSLGSASAIYLTLFLMLMGGAVGLPIPEDVPLVLAGVAAHQSSIELGMANLVCYAGVVFGDIVVFLIGWRFGNRLFEQPWFKVRFTPKRVSSVKDSIERRSLAMIFLARHLFYLRTATFLTCGAVRMSPLRFIISDAVAAMVSVPLMIFLGYTFADQLDRAMGFITQAKHWSIVIIAVVLIVYIIFRWKRGAKNN